jgi:undecaprenyl-diphosphatase
MMPASMRRPLVTSVIVGMLVAIVCGIVAASGDVPAWEVDAFHAVNDLPDALRPAMTLFQYAGLLLVPAVVALGALYVRRWRLAVALLATIPLKLALEKLVVKQLVDRERPATSICGGDTSCGNFRDVPLTGESFVSGHAIIAWSVAALLIPYLRGASKLLPVVVAVANSVARVYLGAHNPLDVVGGAALGVALGSALALWSAPTGRTVVAV